MTILNRFPECCVVDYTLSGAYEIVGVEGVEIRGKSGKPFDVTVYSITTERNRVRLEELGGYRERWKDITAA